MEYIAVAELVRENMPLVQALAARSDVKLSVNFAGDYVIRADPLRLRQILLNLTSNAIKYNRQGGTVVINGGSPREGWFRIEVEDSGRGIAADELPRLFIPFERLESAYSGIEGSGIGLALSRKLTEAMGGRYRCGERSGCGQQVLGRISTGGGGKHRAIARPEYAAGCVEQFAHSTLY